AAPLAARSSLDVITHSAAASRVTLASAATDAKRRDRPRSLAALVLVQPRHDLDEVAGHVPIVELWLQDLVPAVPARPGGARQREQVRAPRDPGAGAALHRRGSDLDHRDMGEDHAEGVDLLLVDVAM